MEALRVHVERIVRPIQAYGGRKNKMREELLGHLEQRVAAGRERGMSDDNAVAYAKENLGDPTQLCAELQATVPAIERMLFVGGSVAALDHWFEKCEGESRLHFAWVRAALTSVFLIMTLAVVIGVNDGGEWLKLLSGERARDWDSYWIIKHYYAPILIVCSAALATFVIYFIADVTGIRKRLSNKVSTGLFVRILSLEIFVGAYVLLFLALAIISVYITRRPASSSIFPPSNATFGLQSILSVLAPSVALLVFVGLPFAAWAIGKEHEQYQRWGRLEIDKP